MNKLDILLLLCFFLTAANGFRMGLIKSLANMVGWILVFILCIKTPIIPLLAPLMSAISQDVIIQKICAFFAVVFGILVITWLVTFILHKILKLLHLSWLNRLGGGALGFAKGLFFVMLILFVTSPVFSRTQAWQNSVIVQRLAPFATDSMVWSKDTVQRTAMQLSNRKSDENNAAHDDIMTSTSADNNKRQVSNPFL